VPDFTFTYDQRLRSGAGGYRGASGRIITSAAVRAELDAAIDAAMLDTRSLSLSLQQGQISLKDWQLSMRRRIKDVHITSAVSQRGGWDQMTQADWGRVGQRIRAQYQFLDNFAQQIADGLPLDGRFLVRSQMYDEAAISTYDRFERNAMKNAGWDGEENILEPGVKHCPGCLEEAAKGIVPIGELTPIGERTCLTRDRCTIKYHNSITGETAI
jgi:hypothetical protein